LLSQTAPTKRLGNNVHAPIGRPSLYSPVGASSGPKPLGAAAPWVAPVGAFPWLPEEVVCWAKEGATVPMIKAMDTATSHPDDLVRMLPTPLIAQHPFTVSERSLGASQLRSQKSSEQLVGGLSILNVLRLCHTNGHDFTAFARRFRAVGLRSSLWVMGRIRTLARMTAESKTAFFYL
jgi:hypothetical protein